MLTKFVQRLSRPLRLTGLLAFSRHGSKLSPMPEGLANVLTKEEILDLLAYLESNGREKRAGLRGSKIISRLG